MRRLSTHDHRAQTYSLKKLCYYKNRKFSRFLVKRIWSPWSCLLWLFELVLLCQRCHLSFLNARLPLLWHFLESGIFWHFAIFPSFFKVCHFFPHFLSKNVMKFVKKNTFSSWISKLFSYFEIPPFLHKNVIKCIK